MSSSPSGWVTSTAATTLAPARSTSSASLLSANKQQLNSAYEMQGMKTHFEQAWMYHVLSSRVRPDSNEFGRLMQTEGLRAALAAAGLAVAGDSDPFPGQRIEPRHRCRLHHR